MALEIERRTFLRGLGVCVALPTLESLAPLARAAAPAATSLATTASGMPLRLGFIAFANGSNYERWLPKGEGRDYELNETFEPAADVRDAAVAFDLTQRLDRGCFRRVDGVECARLLADADHSDVTGL